jgi:hypothetical protein
MKLLAKIMLICFALLLGSISLATCKTRIKSKEVAKEFSKDSSAYTFGEQLFRQPVTVPGDSLSYNLKLEIGNDGKIKPVTVKNNGGRVAFSAIIDSLNNIQIRVNCKEYETQIQGYKTLANSYKLLANKKETQKETPVIIYKIPFWVWLIVGAEGAVILFFIIKTFLPKIF